MISTKPLVSQLPAFGAGYFSGPGSTPAVTATTDPTRATQSSGQVGGQIQTFTPDDGSGDGSEGGQGPAEQKKACKDSGGTWITTGPYGQGYCKPKENSGPCPEGQEQSPFDSNGNDASYPLECVSHAEAQRRFDLRKGKNASGGTPTTGGSGGSGGGGGGGVAKFDPWVPPAQTPFEADLEKQLKDFLDNWDKSVPFTDQVVTNLKTNAFKDSFGRVTANKNAIDADAVQRGIYRSTPRDNRIDAMVHGADSNFTTASRNIDTTAAQQNFQAQMTNRLAALDRAQAHVDKEREYLMTSEMNQFARQSKLAELALAYYTLSQQRWAIQKQLDQAKYQFDTGLNWEKTKFEYDMLNGL